MTDDLKRAARKAGGVGALSLFVMGASWASTELLHRGDSAPHVTQAQRQMDSLYTAGLLRDVSNKLDGMKESLDEMSARMREVCVALRTGCR